MAAAGKVDPVTKETPIAKELRMTMLAARGEQSFGGGDFKPLFDHWIEDCRKRAREGCNFATMSVPPVSTSHPAFEAFLQQIQVIAGRGCVSVHPHPAGTLEILTTWRGWAHWLPGHEPEAFKNNN